MSEVKYILTGHAFMYIEKKVTFLPSSSLCKINKGFLSAITFMCKLPISHNTEINKTMA